ncbi:putative antigenic cell wall protein [Phialemonium atrogriseum]|uniref:Antigenic cell wall protein n=1 Tax=Phialemonium atrogriseum TaxID=1093897 RepID=A0AAJ0BZT9_9PEZI|nr:putative antigenic cell wall protein [Phialemonium atrogriseum]KAK1767514.1 putative antigenic cell wall protein [Phialemonium atrogriseum]
MHMTKFLPAAALLIGNVLADGAAIVAALGTIAADTADLNNTVLVWNGGLLGTLPIIATSTALLVNINKATSTAESSDELSVVEAVTVSLATQALIQDLDTTLTTMIAAKSKFDPLFLSPVILVDLELDKVATDKLSKAIKSKLPADVASAADQLAAQIDAAFDEAINVYKGPW